MSEINSSNDEELKTIVNIKKMKKEKKELSDDVKLIRAKNAKKALDARMSKFAERQKLKKVENNIKNIFNDDDNDDDDNDSIIIQKKKKGGGGGSPQGNDNKRSVKYDIEEPKISKGETQNNNDLLNIISKMSNRVDKLYTMKKMKNNQPKKEIQPVIINDNNKSTSLLESIRNKMINQY